MNIRKIILWLLGRDSVENIVGKFTKAVDQLEELAVVEADVADEAHNRAADLTLAAQDARIKARAAEERSQRALAQADKLAELFK